MKYPILIFYTITTVILGLIIGLHDSILVPYLEVFYVVFTFAESYFVLQNYDFKHGIPFIATFIKLVNTITILIFPIVGLAVHIIIDIYTYSHIRGIDRRNKRLKYDYTVNNIIPGPFLLKVFAAFLSPIIFLIIIIFSDLRIRQKLTLVKRNDLFKYIVLTDVVVLLFLLSPRYDIGFLVYMISLIIFEFIPIENKL